MSYRNLFLLAVLAVVLALLFVVQTWPRLVQPRDAAPVPGVSGQGPLPTDGHRTTTEKGKEDQAFDALHSAAPGLGDQVWTVCSSGCDATSISAAVQLAHVAPEMLDSRLGAVPVRKVVSVGNGIYWEKPFDLGAVELVGALPSGIGLTLDHHGGPTVYFGNTASGALITMGKGSSISNLAIWHLGVAGAGTVPTGPITLIHYRGGEPTSYGRIHNVALRSTTTSLTGDASITYLHADATGKETPAEQYLNVTQLDVLQATAAGGSAQTSVQATGGGKTYFWTAWLVPGPGTGLSSLGGSKIGLYDVKTSQSTGLPGGWGVAEVAVDAASTIYIQASPTSTVSTGQIRALDRSLGAQSLTVTESSGGVAKANVDLWMQSLAMTCLDADGCELTLGTANALPGQRAAIVALTNTVRLSGETQLCNSLEAIYLAGAWRRLAGQGCS